MGVLAASERGCTCAGPDVRDSAAGAGARVNTLLKLGNHVQVGGGDAALPEPRGAAGDGARGAHAHGGLQGARPVRPRLQGAAPYPALPPGACCCCCCCCCASALLPWERLWGCCSSSALLGATVELLLALFFV